MQQCGDCLIAYDESEYAYCPLCSDDEGEGHSLSSFECDECASSGKIECDDCDGTGVYDENKCMVCNGAGELECLDCDGTGWFQG